MKITNNKFKNICSTLLNTAPIKILNFGVSAVTTIILTTIISPVHAVTLFTERSNLLANDLLDWSSLDKVFNPLAPPDPNSFLPNSFNATSEAGLNIEVTIPFQQNVTPPFVFQTLPIPNGIPTNFSNGDFILFTGLTPGIFPAPGNDGPLTLNFEQPVFGAGTQIAVDDTLEFTAFISAFDINDNLLGEFAADGTSSLELDNSAIFLGINSDQANISKLVYSSSVSNRALGINQLSLVTEITSVPESKTDLSLLCLGILGIYLVRPKFRS